MTSNEIRLNFLLADFNSIKAEIGRRSDQQKTAYVLYLTVLAWVTTRIFSGDVNPYYVLIILFVVYLLRNFVKREEMEIGKLSNLINKQICVEIKSITGDTDLKLIPSEDVNCAIDKSCHLRYSLDREFKFVILWVLPSALMFYILFENKFIFCK